MFGVGLVGVLRRAFEGTPVAGEGQQREVLPIEVIRQIKDPREAGRRVLGLAPRPAAGGLIPAAVWPSPGEEPADAPGGRIGPHASRHPPSGFCTERIQPAARWTWGAPRSKPTASRPRSARNVPYM